MSPPCTVCPRPDREAIDAALLAGEPYRAITAWSRVPKSNLGRHRQHVSMRDTGGLSRIRNTVRCVRDLELLRALPDGSVDVWWASPPYNNADDFRGGNARQKKVSYRYAGGTGRGDGHCMPEAAYQAWQVRVLNEWHRTLAGDGVAFYSHKIRPKDKRTIHPLEWVNRTLFVPPTGALVGYVTWARRGTPNTDSVRFYPTQEVVLILAKRPGWYIRNQDKLCDVWDDIPSLKRADTGHPCATPPELVRRCLANLRPFADGRRPLVADCYAGTGTTGLVAQELGMDYLLGEGNPDYAERARAALEAGAGQAIA
jgi:DNA modification methylase